MAAALLFILFLLVAMVYAIAGLGGASTYVALLFVFDTPVEMLPKVALTCNLIVVTAGAFTFMHAGHFTGRVLLPFALASVPVALWSATLHLSKEWFMGVLAVVMFIVGLRMLLTLKAEGKPMEELSLLRVWMFGLPMGATLGAVAGIVGVGGGVFLAPILSILHWGSARQIAATSAGFVMVTSVAALTGHLIKSNDLIPFTEYMYLYPAVFIGGIIGARFGAAYVPVVAMRLLTAVLALGVAGTLLFGIWQNFLHV